MRTYIAIDLKSFYASVECVARGLDPLTTNLVVADGTRTEKTICLAVSPSLKALGLSGRSRLFEVVERVKLENACRRERLPGRAFTGSSCQAPALARDPGLAVDYLVAPPRMAAYMEVSGRVYGMYLKYIAPEDIHVYSIDEVFLDVTNYLQTYRMTARELAKTMLRDVLETTGITATAGIGPNLYLCKIAMDIVAKHLPPDKNGVRIAELDELGYRRQLWDHRPLTDFWRVGKGMARKLEQNGLYTMGDVARCSRGAEHDYLNEELLYKLFGVNAELLIDHAWGWEPCTIADVKAYRPEFESKASGQVLQEPYSFEKARLVVREMGEALALQLVEEGRTTAQLTLTVGYDRVNLTDPDRRARYSGPVQTDSYGRPVPRSAHGTTHFQPSTASTRKLLEGLLALFDRIVDRSLLVRRLSLSVERLGPEEAADQLSLFTDPAEQRRDSRERLLQETMVAIRRKHGKNALLKAMDLEEGATAIQRNGQIGGHRA